MLWSWRTGFCSDNATAVTLVLQICCDDCGSWSVRGLSAQTAADFPSLAASIDYARRECGGAPATIELMVDGFYAVIYQDNGWPRQLVAPQAEPLGDVEGTDGGDRPRFGRLSAWVTARRRG
jgi:hypothetical protein